MRGDFFIDSNALVSSNAEGVRFQASQLSVPNINPFTTGRIKTMTLTYIRIANYILHYHPLVIKTKTQSFDDKGIIQRGTDSNISLDYAFALIASPVKLESVVFDYYDSNAHDEFETFYLLENAKFQYPERFQESQEDLKMQFYTTMDELLLHSMTVTIPTFYAHDINISKNGDILTTRIDNIITENDLYFVPNTSYNIVLDGTLRMLFKNIDTKTQEKIRACLSNETLVRDTTEPLGLSILFTKDEIVNFFRTKFIQAEFYTGSDADWFFANNKITTALTDSEGVWVVWDYSALAFSNNGILPDEEVYSLMIEGNGGLVSTSISSTSRGLWETPPSSSPILIQIQNWNDEYTQWQADTFPELHQHYEENNEKYEEIKEKFAEWLNQNYTRWPDWQIYQNNLEYNDNINNIYTHITELHGQVPPNYQEIQNYIQIPQNAYGTFNYNTYFADVDYYNNVYLTDFQIWGDWNIGYQSNKSQYEANQFQSVLLAQGDLIIKDTYPQKVSLLNELNAIYDPSNLQITILERKNAYNQLITTWANSLQNNIYVNTSAIKPYNLLLDESYESSDESIYPIEFKKLEEPQKPNYLDYPPNPAAPPSPDSGGVAPNLIPINKPQDPTDPPASYEEYLRNLIQADSAKAFPGVIDADPYPVILPENTKAYYVTWREATGNLITNEPQLNLNSIQGPGIYTQNGTKYYANEISNYVVSDSSSISDNLLNVMIAHKPQNNQNKTILEESFGIINDRLDNLGAIIHDNPNEFNIEIAGNFVNYRLKLQTDEEDIVDIHNVLRGGGIETSVFTSSIETNFYPQCPNFYNLEGEPQLFISSGLKQRYNFLFPVGKFDDFKFEFEYIIGDENIVQEYNYVTSNQRKIDLKLSYGTEEREYAGIKIKNNESITSINLLPYWLQDTEETREEKNITRIPKGLSLKLSVKFHDQILTENGQNILTGKVKTKHVGGIHTSVIMDKVEFHSMNLQSLYYLRPTDMNRSESLNNIEFNFTTIRGVDYPILSYDDLLMKIEFEKAE